jgi:nitrate reductase NapE component
MSDPGEAVAVFTLLTAVAVVGLVGFAVWKVFF